uniref:Putative LOC100373520 [Saccoglossus kowalevskii] n=3 Tax=Lepeophtheirus salmonis TaxID=72036 RepID=A0A0K2UD87_LEPSM
MNDRLTFGSRTREFHKAWTTAGHSIRIQEQQVRPFFNTYLDLYPSDSQIHEMVRCAREIEDSSLKEFYLTFGEVCVLASELKTRSDSPNDPPVSITSKKRFNSLVETSSNSTLKEDEKNSNYDIFLGGSCNPTTWRSEVAIPYLKSSYLTFYNPQLPNWSPELIQLEHQAKQTSKILFFVLNEQTRNAVSMIEVSYYAGVGRTLITVLGSYVDKMKQLDFNGEIPTSEEIEDLSSGLLVVHDLIERENAPVFTDIERALKCSNQLLNCTTSQRQKSDYFQDLKFVKDGKIKIGDEILRVREAFDALDTSRNGIISGDDLKMAFRVHTHRDLSQEDLEQIISIIGGKNASVNFEQFCCIVSEFKKKMTSECYLRKDATETFSPKASSFFQNFVSPVSKFFHRVLSRSPSCSFPQVKYRRRQGGSQYFRSRRGSSIRDVYLGGAIDASGDDWKNTLAIPLLKKNGLTFFAPKSYVSQKRRTPIDFSSIDSSRVIFFFIPGRCKYLAEMCEASYYIGQGCNVILCLQPLKEDEPSVSAGLRKDYCRGRSYLSDIANREGIPVFEELSEGLDCLISKCKSSKLLGGAN